ncbi:MAG TPA: DUF2752 domain-containing protein [Bacteroidetes bacterium]|nr:DUF2752 domain-containing protein [Bacteroidota bacterium]
MEAIANALESNMLTCPSKALAGITCPGCGFQTASVALLRGNLADTWEHYPPLFPFLLLMLLLLFFLVSRYRYRLHLLLGAFFTTLAFITVNYFSKLL